MHHPAGPGRRPEPTDGRHAGGQTRAAAHATHQPKGRQQHDDCHCAPNHPQQKGQEGDGRRGGPNGADRHLAVG